MTGTERQRPRDLGIVTGALPPGPWNAITDVAGVRVGHLTLVEGDDIRTGITVVLPHGGNLFREKVPAGFACLNGFGKFAGSTQVEELGEIETPVAVTSTLAVGAVMEGLIRHTLALPGNEDVQSVNAVVGEINDGYLNDARSFPIRPGHVAAAIAAASEGPVVEGSAGAGTGARALGWKGGVGTASRRLPSSLGGHVLGVLAVANFGGFLTVAGVPVWKDLGGHPFARELGSLPEERGSVILIVATDAPCDARSLRRIAARTFLALGRVGSFASNGSGDYALAFSTAPEVRIAAGARRTGAPVLGNEAVSPLLLAAVEAAEEALLDAVFMATAVRGRGGHEVPALPLHRVLPLLRARGLPVP